MNYYFYKPESVTDDLGLLSKIQETVSLNDIQVFQHPSDCTRDLLLNLQSKKILILFIDKTIDAEIFATVKNLISDVPIFIFLVSPDRFLPAVCQKLRPRMLCREKKDVDDFIHVIHEMSMHAELN